MKQVETSKRSKKKHARKSKKKHANKQASKQAKAKAKRKNSLSLSLLWCQTVMIMQLQKRHYKSQLITFSSPSHYVSSHHHPLLPRQIITWMAQISYAFSSLQNHLGLTATLCVMSSTYSHQIRASADHPTQSLALDT